MTSDTAQTGWVYIMTNRSMPGLVKIGYTTIAPEERARQLHTTGTPHQFRVEYCAYVKHPSALENAVHRDLKERHEAKEFFRMRVDNAIEVLQQVAERNCIVIIRERCSDTQNSIQTSTARSTMRCHICQTRLNGFEGDRCNNCFALLR